MNPTGRSHLRVNIFECDREVYQIEVQILDPHALERSEESWFHIFWSVVLVPQFGHNEEVFSLDQVVIECTVNTITHLIFIAVDLSSIKEPRASLN